MKFKINGKIVSIDLCKDGTLSIMDKEGNNIEQTLERAKVEIISKDVMTITGFEITPFGKFSFQELHLFNMFEDEKAIAKRLALWAWGKKIPTEIAELEKWLLRGLKEAN